MNVESSSGGQVSKWCILSILKKDRAKPPARRGFSAYASESDSTLRNSAVRYSLFCGSLLYSHVVSHERRRWPEKTASLIEKETNEHRTSNECILSVLKKISRSDSFLRHSLFDIRYSAVRFSARLSAAKATGLITKKSCHFGVASYKRSSGRLPSPIRPLAKYWELV